MQQNCLQCSSEKCEQTNCTSPLISEIKIPNDERIRKIVQDLFLFLQPYDDAIRREEKRKRQERTEENLRNSIREREALREEILEIDTDGIIVSGLDIHLHNGEINYSSGVEIGVGWPDEADARDRFKTIGSMKPTIFTKDLETYVIYTVYDMSQATLVITRLRNELRKQKIKDGARKIGSGTKALAGNLWQGVKSTGMCAYYNRQYDRLKNPVDGSNPSDEQQQEINDVVDNLLHHNCTNPTGQPYNTILRRTRD